MAADRIILVKHSMPVIVPDAPPPTWVLSEDGREASSRLARDLARYQPVAVVTSVEPKTVETGEVIATSLGIPATTAVCLHERDREPFEDTERFHTRMRRFFSEPDTVVYGAETADAAHARFERAIQSVSAAHPPGTMIIVSHGTVMSLLVARANELDPFPFWVGLDLPSFVVIDRTSFTLVPSD